jgi:hypothetical protein
MLVPTSKAQVTATFYAKVGSNKKFLPISSVVAQGKAWM